MFSYSICSTCFNKKLLIIEFYFQTGLNTLTHCLDDVYDFTKLKENRPELAYETVKALLTKGCASIPSALKCLVNFSPVLNHCLTSDEIETKNTLGLVFLKTIEYVCDGKGEDYVKSLTESGFDCAVSKAKQLGQCFNGVEEKYKSLFAKGSDATYVLDHIDCGNFNNIGGCVISTLDECDDKSPTLIVKDLFEIAKKELYCDA